MTGGVLWATWVRTPAVPIPCGGPAGYDEFEIVKGPGTLHGVASLHRQQPGVPRRRLPVPVWRRLVRRSGMVPAVIWYPLRAVVRLPGTGRRRAHGGGGPHSPPAGSGRAGTSGRRSTWTSGSSWSGAATGGRWSSGRERAAACRPSKTSSPRNVGTRATRDGPRPGRRPLSPGIRHGMVQGEPRPWAERIYDVARPAVAAVGRSSPGRWLRASGGRARGGRPSRPASAVCITGRSGEDAVHPAGPRLRRNG